VFIDRFYGFEGGVPENSWIGITLELGAVGAALLVAIWLSLGWIFIRGAPARWSGGGSPAPAFTAAAIAGLLLTVGQSYIYSVGNVATVTVWFSMFFVASASTASGGWTRVGRGQAA
jgi:hypothetical protein